MKITIQDCGEGEEEEIIVRCRHVDNTMLKMIYAVKAGHEKLTVFKEDKLFQVEPGSIYYFEAVDNKVFAYMDTEVYEIKRKLYELEEMFLHTDFFRASKSTIINLSNVKNLSPSFSGRFEACMKNGERLLISRQYVPELKEKLGLKG
ncbi:MAG: LytTR family transcriptional regulator DNA-binding domain-containing protein [Muribaculaceae bacterium]|nr:LytTR family transcriptional regulator DNA-binding domain-containing protein [Roseburia sp.]MCM1430315.1 LytTR family transcriptional regulator DNA-binding domain-containing protein [Muribaculaceae bacterium]MCM1492489.1 LytTR family transcriptional regulator DNA-binding domain-containing protein [Muribaculaceae bacterium]